LYVQNFYFRFDNYNVAWIIVLPPLRGIWKYSPTAFATITITENNHDKAGGYLTYV